MYLPWLAGERAPFTDPDARACFLGLSGATTKEDMHRAVLEGVAFSFRDLRDCLCGASPPAILRAVGGGTHSPGWMQMFADVLGCEIHVVIDAGDVGVKGAALMASQGLGWTPAAGGGSGGFTAVAAVYRPVPTIVPLYDRLYAVYARAHDALGPVFTQMAEALHTHSSH